MDTFWYQLLLTLENQLAEQGNTLDNGERLKLVVDYPEGTPESVKVATNFPAQLACILDNMLHDGYPIATTCHIQTTGRALTYPNDHLLQQNHPVRDGGKMSEAEGSLRVKQSNQCATSSKMPH